jgi:hypothetical protein
MAVENFSPLPPPNSSMTRVHDFTSDLPRATKIVEKIKEIVEIVYRYKGLKRKLFYEILKII